MTALADPTAPPTDPAAQPATAEGGRTSGEDDRPPQPHALGGGPAAAPRGAAAETHGRRSGDSGRARPTRPGKLEGVRRCGLCGCGAAATTDAAEEAVEAGDAPRWTVEEELARARRRFEAISAAAAVVPTVVVQPDSELCLCEVDRSSSGPPSSAEAVNGDGSAAAGANRGHETAGGAQLAASDAGSSGSLKSQELGTVFGAHAEGSESSDGIAESARVADEQALPAFGAQQSEARVEDEEAGAAGEPCFCYRIDLGASDFEHVLR